MQLNKLCATVLSLFLIIDLNASSNLCRHSSNQLMIADQLEAIKTKDLKEFVQRGNNLYVTDHNWSFDFNKATQMDVQGNNNYGIWKIKIHKKLMAIKKLGQAGLKELDQAALKEIKNAKAVYLLGVGPQTELVCVRGQYYLVMDFVPGINSKDLVLLEPGGDLTKTTLEIESILNTKFLDARAAICSYLKLLLADRKFVRVLHNKMKPLKKNGFDVHDLQLMILPATAFTSLTVNVIDGHYFERHPIGAHLTNDPEVVIKKLIDKMQVIMRKKCK